MFPEGSGVELCFLELRVACLVRRFLDKDGRTLIGEVGELKSH